MVETPIIHQKKFMKFLQNVTMRLEKFKYTCHDMPFFCVKFFTNAKEYMKSEYFHIFHFIFIFEEKKLSDFFIIYK
jgi:hypothetical protein